MLTLQDKVDKVAAAQKRLSAMHAALLSST